MPPTIFAGLLGLLLILSEPQAFAQIDSLRESIALSSDIRLFTTPDEFSPPGVWIRRGETVTPVAEIQGANGLKWFLVRTRNGSVGWTKQSNSEESKKLDNFFKSLPPEPSSLSSVEISTTSSATAPHGAVTVPVQISGRSIIIPVIFNHSLKTQLLLDTGATSTLVSKSIASSLALQEIGSATGVTVGGAITVPVARVKSLKVGSAEVVDLLVNIHNFSQDPRYEGLLGMDFLGRFNISLDQHKRVLILTPR